MQQNSLSELVIQVPGKQMCHGNNHSCCVCVLISSPECYLVARQSSSVQG